MTTFSRIDGLARRVDQALAGIERLKSVIARVDELALNKKIEAASKQAEEIQRLVQTMNATLDELNQQAQRRVGEIERELDAVKQRASRSVKALERDVLDNKKKFEEHLTGFRKQVEEMLKAATQTITTIIDEQMKEVRRDILDVKRNVEAISKAHKALKDTIEANVQVLEQWKPLIGGPPFKGKLRHP